ncbi:MULTISPECIES: hypothetical protein [unclassified Crossiella]|uniref:hypothetical protein n=1 Tax=unclassified Crossiella TaxID=2620835 RepID=UPI001FFF4A82|nr:MULTISPECIES: hypothetical protein [unclassified Crossiella]MCK2239969.1 hypothetical protein [Crossiella sp. S99.2]MCK2252677.1 hypothetical protein [Crossiella sp. S99.1]
MRVTSTFPAEENRFVGRVEILDRLADSWSETCRVVTLAGAPGIGKTRLAVGCARRAAAADEQTLREDGEALYPDGVWLAQLADVKAAQDVDVAVARALALGLQSPQPPREVLLAHLRERRLLLVLDNCEHLVGAVAELLMALLPHAPGLRVLVTSVSWLGIRSERIEVVEPLTIPSTDDHDSSEAMELLLDRAAANHYDIRGAGREEIREAVALCRVLDGIPLAIELIALQLTDLTVAQARRLLENMMAQLQLDLLSADNRAGWTPRQQCMDSVLHLHYQRCGSPDSQGEQRLWERLSVFTGGWDLADAEAVCSDLDKHGRPSGRIGDEPVRVLLNRLVRQSVIIVDRDPRRQQQARYRQLEILRVFGAGRLALRTGEEDFRLRHAHYFQARSRQAAEQWLGKNELVLFGFFRANLSNYYEAITTLQTTPGLQPAAVEMVLHLGDMRLWWWVGELRQGREFIRTTVSHLEQALSPAERAGMLELLHAAAVLDGWLSLCMGDQHGGAAAVQRAVALAETQPRLATLPERQFLTGAYAMCVTRDFPRAVEMLALAQRGYAAAGVKRNGARHTAGLILAISAAFSEDAVLAAEVTARCVEDARKHQAPWAITWARWAQTVWLLRHVRSAPALKKALQVADEILLEQHAMGDLWGYAWSMSLRKWILAELQHFEQSAIFSGFARHMQNVLGVVLDGIGPHEDQDRIAEASARDALGTKTFEVLHGRGLRLSEERILGLVRQPESEHAAVYAVDSPLTPGLVAVAARVGARMTNAEIAVDLNNTRRTVEFQVSQCYSKLGFAESNPRDNRPLLARWARENFPDLVSEIEQRIGDQGQASA